MDSSKICFSQEGVTLIEVIMIMVIIAILTSVALPKMGFDLPTGASLEGAAQMVASDIRYAQESAMATRTSRSVIFTSGSSVYTFNPVNNLDPSGQLPSGAMVTNNFTVTFNSLGEPIAGGGGFVTVSVGGQTKTISITNYTGKVNIS